MTDTTPAPEVPKATLWSRYRGLPIWAQILILLAILAAIVLVIYLVAQAGDDDSQDTSTTDTATAAPSSDDRQALSAVLAGIALGQILTTDSTTTTTAPPTTVTTTATTAATTSPATTTPTTPPTPTTAAAAPTTGAPSTTPTSTAASTVPTVSIPEGQVAESPEAFATAWNAAIADTDLTPIDPDQLNVVDGTDADALVQPLSDQVGLAGVIRTDDGALAAVLLVWIPPPDQASNALYREAFQTLAGVLDPALTDAEKAGLADTLGLGPTQPPFPSGTEELAPGQAQQYRLIAGDTPEIDGVTVIEVSALPAA